VQAAAVSVHEAAVGDGDELAERRHPVLERAQLSRWAASGPKAGTQTARYSAPSGVE
jgi:hypothetical protein